MNNSIVTPDYAYCYTTLCLLLHMIMLIVTSDYAYCYNWLWLHVINILKYELLQVY